MLVKLRSISINDGKRNNSCDYTFVKSKGRRVLVEQYASSYLDEVLKKIESMINLIQDFILILFYNFYSKAKKFYYFYTLSANYIKD